jgi:TPP-dependent 2-oxoacid decarboxylase
LVKEFNTKLHTINGDNDSELLRQLFKSPEVYAKVAERAAKYPLNLTPSAQLSQRNVVHILQQWFSSSNAAADPLAPTHVLVDSGDSLISGLKLRIPEHGSYAVQLLYGSLGWASSAAVGYALGLKDSGKRGRLVVMQGDGGFQMGTQEWSTMMRYGLDVVVLLLNNQVYLVENEILPGAFNDLVEWDYVALAQALKGRDGKSKLHAVRARTNEQLTKALDEVSRVEGLCVVEVCVAKDDCNFELTQWAHSIAPSAVRPPRA